MIQFVKFKKSKKIHNISHQLTVGVYLSLFIISPNNTRVIIVRSGVEVAPAGDPLWGGIPGDALINRDKGLYMSWTRIRDTEDTYYPNAQNYCICVQTDFIVN